MEGLETHRFGGLGHPKADRGRVPGSHILHTYQR